MNTCTEQTCDALKSGDAQPSSANDARSAIMNVQVVAQVSSGRKRETNN